MQNATLADVAMFIAPLRRLSRAERQRRLAERQRWLQEVDLLDAFNNLFDFMPEYRFFLKRRAGEIMFVSRIMLQTIHAADEASLIGIFDNELTPGPLASLYQQRDEHVLNSGQPLCGVMEVWFTREGLPEWFTCYKLPLKNHRGEIVGIIGFLKEFNQSPVPSVGAPIRTLLEYIEANLHSPLTVLDLAEKAYLSPRQVERLFKRVLGTSPKAFITKMRIHKAANLLLEGELSISRIALEVGFSDQSALTYYFRRELGITPFKFRRAALIWKQTLKEMRRLPE